MPSLEKVKQFRQQMFQESMTLIDKKGADYNRQQQNNGDTLFNLRVSELLGIVPTAEQGILVRLSDKFMRLISLMPIDVEAAVKDESIRDTVRDFHNYLDYCLQLREERQEALRTKYRDAKIVTMPMRGVDPASNIGPLNKTPEPTR